MSSKAGTLDLVNPPVGLPTPTPTDAQSIADALSSWSDVALNIAQVIALIVGGWWAYTRFIRQREGMPRADLKHEVRHFDLPDGRRLLRVIEQINNTGDVLLQLQRRITRLQQILPMEGAPLESLEKGDQQEATWFQLGRQHEVVNDAMPPQIEPGEKDHFEHDFLVDSEAQVIQVYSYFQNASGGEKDDRGWTLTTLYDLRNTQATEQEMTSLTTKEEPVAHKKESQQKPKSQPATKQQAPKPAPQAKPSSTGANNTGNDKK